MTEEIDISDNYKKTISFEGNVLKIVENDEETYIYVGNEDGYIISYVKLNNLKLKRKTKLRLRGKVVKKDDDYMIKIKEIKNLEIETLQGIEEIEIDGVVSFCETVEDEYTYFEISHQKKKFACVSETILNLEVYDVVSITGNLELQKGLEYINVTNIIVKCVFSLERLIAFSFKFGEENSRELARKIEDFCVVAYPDLEDPQDNFHYKKGDIYYSVINCLTDLSKNLYNSSKESLNSFLEFIFDSEPDRYREKLNEMLVRFSSQYIYRIFSFFNLEKAIVDEMMNSRNIHRCYDLIFKSPNRIIEIPDNKLNTIYKIYLESEPKDKDVHLMAKFIYNSYKDRNWTSVSATKLREKFPTNFDEKVLKLPEFSIRFHLDHYYYKPVLIMEKFVSKKVSLLISSKETNLNIQFTDTRLSDEQKEAIIGATTKRISIITGGAGTGKTSVLTEIEKVLKLNGRKALYCAYVGAAVQKIKEAVEERDFIMTIHLAITLRHELKNVDFSHVIFDECSMIDLELFYNFMCCFASKNISYIFIGDINQLEPMAAGNLMKQFLKMTIPIFTLRKNYRSETGIVRLLEDIVSQERIEKGQAINWYRYQKFPCRRKECGHCSQCSECNQCSDCSYCKDCPNCPEICTECQKCSSYSFHEGGMKKLTTILKAQYSFIPEEDRQNIDRVIDFIGRMTIVTFYREKTDEINRIVKSIFFNSFDHVAINKILFCIRDKVMNKKNNYNIDVMNGEIGEVIEIDRRFVGVQFSKEKAIYFSEETAKELRSILKTCKVICDEEGKLSLKSGSSYISSEMRERLNWFLMVAEKYGKCIVKGNMPAKIFSVKQVQHAYSVTVRKSQGNQYPICYYYHDSKIPYFINRRVIYTGVSRAQTKLRVICESMESLNKSLLYSDVYTSENLVNHVNSYLPEELIKPVIPEEENEFDEFGDFDDFDSD